MEACGCVHYWGREIGKLVHEVRLIPPAYVKPFVKRQENDAADAEAICEAAQRPTMRYVPVKREETQGAAMVLWVRELHVHNSDIGRHSTQRDHMPAHHQFREDWTPQRTQARAARIGRNVTICRELGIPYPQIPLT